jgi:DNA-binding response OmpR family regulator
MMAEGKPTILYIDDDQDCLDGVRIVLEANGYEMKEARSAEDGLKLFRERRPDLVIVDLMMEEVDSGTAFVKELQALGADVPIYMLSSVGDSMSMTTDYTALGLAGVFQKPIQTGTLLTVLRAKLGRTMTG